MCPVCFTGTGPCDLCKARAASIRNHPSNRQNRTTRATEEITVNPTDAPTPAAFQKGDRVRITSTHPGNTTERTSYRDLFGVVTRAPIGKNAGTVRIDPGQKLPDGQTAGTGPWTYYPDELTPAHAFPEGTYRAITTDVQVRHAERGEYTVTWPSGMWNTRPEAYVCALTLKTEPVPVPFPISSRVVQKTLKDLEPGTVTAVSGTRRLVDWDDANTMWHEISELNDAPAGDFPIGSRVIHLGTPTIRGTVLKRRYSFNVPERKVQWDDGKTTWHATEFLSAPKPLAPVGGLATVTIVPEVKPERPLPRFTLSDRVKLRPGVPSAAARGKTGRIIQVGWMGWDYRVQFANQDGSKFAMGFMENELEAAPATITELPTPKPEAGIFTAAASTPAPTSFTGFTEHLLKQPLTPWQRTLIQQLEQPRTITISEAMRRRGITTEADIQKLEDAKLTAEIQLDAVNRSRNVWKARAEKAENETASLRGTIAKQAKQLRQLRNGVEGLRGL